MTQEFVNYLHANKGYQRFMNAWYEKYVSLSHIGGSIILKHATKQEIDAISSLLGSQFIKQDTIRISYKKMEKALLLTKFTPIDFESVLHLYFKEDIETKKSRIEKNNEYKQTLMQNLKNSYKHTKAYDFLEIIEDSEPQVFQQFIKMTKVNLNTITSVLTAINLLPVWNREMMSLAVFANKITKDPHYFDKGVSLKYLLFGIECLLDTKISPNSQIEKNELLAKAGILREVTNNYISLFHVFALTHDGSDNEGLHYYAQIKQSINLNLSNVKGIHKLYGIDYLLIIENPSIFEVLMQYIIDKQYTNIGLICTNGELNLAAYLMLSIIKESNIHTYYAGDFDPEGLLIAQRIYERLNEDVCFLGYNEKYYQISKSSKTISSLRLEKIKKPLCDKLEPIKQLLQQSKLAGYQESLVDEYRKFLDEWHNTL